MNGKPEAVLAADRPLSLGQGVSLVGFWDSEAGLRCNPYLVCDGDEAVLIDGGSRPDFPTVMMKVLQAGVSPHQIKALIYSHFDPDLCGSIPNLEDMIRRPDLVLISAAPNHMFIRHYSTTSRLVSLADIGFRFRFASGRELRFTTTPFAHAPGSFVTFDTATGILFTGDLFGSPGIGDSIFLSLTPTCFTDHDRTHCPEGRETCPLQSMAIFHKQVMPSTLALHHAMATIRTIPFKALAPQHGAIIREAKDAELAIATLETLENVGIDGLVAQDPQLAGRSY